MLCLQTLPYCACLTSIECGWLLIYAIGSPSGTTAFKVSPQGACINLAVVGSAACIITCLASPHMSHHVKRRAPVTMKRMSRLGLVSHDCIECLGLSWLGVVSHDYSQGLLFSCNLLWAVLAAACVW